MNKTALFDNKLRGGRTDCRPENEDDADDRLDKLLSKLLNGNNDDDNDDDDDDDDDDGWGNSPEELRVVLDEYFRT